MKNELKKEVLDFLQNLPKEKYEQYNQAVQFYRKIEPKNYAAERNYNLGLTDSNLRNILYDIQKGYGITDIEIAAKPVVVDTQKVEVPEATGKQDIDESKGEEGAGTDEQGADESKGEENTKLRDDFSFLDDADCPNELKILVADKMMAFRKWKDANSKLVAHSNKEIELTEEEVSELSKVSVENFEENQKIYAELNHYQEHKEILGKHPIFDKLNLEKKVDGMTNEQLVKALSSTSKSISENGKKLKNEKNAEKIEKYKATIKRSKQMQDLVKKKLNFQK